MQQRIRKKTKNTGGIILLFVLLVIGGIGFWLKGDGIWYGLGGTKTDNDDDDDDDDENGNGNGGDPPLTCDDANQELNTAGDACECVDGYSFDDDGTTCIGTNLVDKYVSLITGSPAGKSANDYAYQVGTAELCRQSAEDAGKNAFIYKDIGSTGANPGRCNRFDIINWSDLSIKDGEDLVLGCSSKDKSLQNSC